MPITPNKISAVVLYGKKTCNRLVEILNYWQTILTEAAWDSVFFLCVTRDDEDWKFPGEGEPTVGTQALLAKQLVRCMPMKVDCKNPAQAMMPVGYLQTLQFKISAGNVMVHCICDDLSAAPPAEAAHALVASAQSYLGEGNVSCLYYLLLRDSLAARQQQRMLADIISNRQPGAAVYLLGQIANNGSRLHKFELRRAVMSEILVAAQGMRSYAPPMVYTLGYTSLNANDQELYSLRRDAIANLLRNAHSEPITKPDAWDILTRKSGQQPQDYNEYAIQTAVNNWVSSVAENFVAKPKDRELENLRILAGINTPEEAVGLYEACNKFFEVNMTARTDVALNKSVEKHIDSVLAELRQYINICGFPLTLLQNMRNELNNIQHREIHEFRPALPRRRLLQKKEEYLNECAQMMSNHVRGTYVAKAASKVAAGLVQGFSHIEKVILRMQGNDNFAYLLQGHQLAATAGINLRQKYPKYTTDMDQTIVNGMLSHFGPQWLRGAGAIYDQEFQLDKAAISALVDSGVETLHKNMSTGFNSTFMDALHTEFNTSSAMATFLNQYLFNNNRIMFNCPFVQTNIQPNDTKYYVDANLQNMPWVQNQQGHVIIANNDNIEKVVFGQVEKGLHWMISNWTTDNHCFGLHPDPMVGGAGNWVNAGFAAAPVENRVVPTMEMPQPEGNPRNLRLTLIENRFMLTWNWEAGMKAVLVSVNGGAAKPVDAGKYTMDGGMDVTDQVTYGRNVFTLNRTNHSEYGKMSLCGKRYPVKYRFATSPKGNGVTLKLSGSIPANAALMLCERSGDGKHCFYPVAARGLRGEVNYEGLKLAGTYELTTAPEEQFPVVKPVQDISM